MIIASFFVFMLLHGSAVSSELYPIPQVEDIIQEQPEWSDDNYIELQEAILASISQQNDRDDLAWIRTAIVDGYKFKKDPSGKDIWTEQPDFKDALGTPDFFTAATRVERFFKRNDHWETTKKDPAYLTKDSCINLLYITAARYLLVTHILYVTSVASGNKLVPCVKTKDKKIEIPASGVCYPAPYGSATCTSDYDVGLIGNDAGLVIKAFNKYFEDTFGKPSELVFDTNVYAFSLAFAMPSLFVGLPNTFVNDLKNIEETDDFKMQELASAYYKVFKYNEESFNVLVKGAKEAINTLEPVKSKSLRTQLDKWLQIFAGMNVATPMKVANGATQDSLINLRNAHNKEYEKYVETIKYEAKYQDYLARAEIYAAEAYHTRGAIRHVVGVMQMKTKGLSNSLTFYDWWVSMIENWGESNKEYNHCGNVLPEVCFLKMSKYLWRMFKAMKTIRVTLSSNGINVQNLMQFGSEFLDPDRAMEMWNGYKKEGKDVTKNKYKEQINLFLKKLKCHDNGVTNLPACMSRIQDEVNAYNTKLFGPHGKQQLIPHKVNIKF